MGRLLMRPGTPSSRTRMPTCRCRAAAEFIPAPMHYFMRFNGCDGMHAGYLPGYPASHGCVRMPEQYASCVFQRRAASGLRSLCSAGRQSTATTQANRNRVFSAVHVSAHSWVRAFRLRLLRNVVAVNRDLQTVHCPSAAIADSDAWQTAHCLPQAAAA